MPSDNPLPTAGTSPISDAAPDPLKGAGYEPIKENWFTAKPYGFRFTSRKGEELVMNLPLGPSNLSIATQFATNLIPTIGGTIEEHSPVRYYDISIEGTTGMTPKFVKPSSGSSIKSESGRSAFTVQQSLSTLAGGFFKKTLAAAQNVFNSAQDLAGRSAVTGVYLDQTGYLAFHNLYRFFLKYKQDVSGVTSGTGKNGEQIQDNQTPRAEGAGPPLVFFNHKDGNEYSVVVKSFLLRRDKENPMLYSFSIQLRGYDLREIKDTAGSRGVVDSQELLAALGLNGVKSSTILSEIKAKADLARDILGSVASGVNQLGR